MGEYRIPRPICSIVQAQLIAVIVVVIMDGVQGGQHSFGTISREYLAMVQTHQL